MPGGRQEALLGAAFGVLTVCDEAPGGRGADRRVRCRCQCGVTKTILVTSLRSGRTRSCGCAHWRADPDRTVSATAHLALMVSPLVVAQVAVIAFVSGLTSASFARSAVETFVDDADAAVALVQSVHRRRQPAGATCEMRLRVTPETRQQAEAVARQAEQTLTVVGLMALHVASRESGAASLIAPAMLPVYRPARLPGIASRVGGVGLHRPVYWRRKFPGDDDDAD
jgi:hypothetical protein